MAQDAKNATDNKRQYFFIKNTPFFKIHEWIKVDRYYRTSQALVPPNEQAKVAPENNNESKLIERIRIKSSVFLSLGANLAI